MIRKLKAVILLIGMLSLASCGQELHTSQSGTVKPKSKPTSASSTFYASKEPEETSPLDAHMRARRMVDPSDTSLTHNYTTLAGASNKAPPAPPRKPGKKPSNGSFMASLSGLITPDPSQAKPDRELKAEPVADSPKAAVDDVVYDPNAPIPQQKPSRAQKLATKTEIAPPPVQDPVRAAAPQKKPPMPRMSAAEIKHAQSLEATRNIQKPRQKPAFKKTIKTNDSSRNTGKSTTVSNVRIGNYEEKTRVVMDLNGPAKFDYDKNVKGQDLTINLPGVTWRTDGQKRFPSHPLLERYSIVSGNKGAVLKIHTKKPAKLVQSSYLPPNKVYGHRIYFDIAPI